MLMPSIFGENLLDDFFGYPFRGHHYEANTTELMKTDIKDTDQGYEITMNLPGVKKENVTAELKDGYLTINATSNSENNEKDDNGKYIRRERFSGSCSRSFYVGDAMTQEDIKAKFENGTLKLMVPKKEAQPAVENKKYISIEG
ncbi:MAG: Hsp20/alpha crystallin family protein [Lachnospiraceae bacterium]|nr:Hsp20/alpha crystallin family protein [Lachnospiraceae bacterium]